MGDLKSTTTTEEPSSLSSKRNPDLECLDEEKELKKIRTDEISGDNIVAKEFNKEEDEVAEDDDEDAEDEEDDEDDDEDGEEVEVPSNGKSVVVDNKGKGIMREDKGKGKLKVEDCSDDDDDDDSTEGRNHSDDDDSDLSDDPLAEVDLDNILPSRTRRRAAQPGVYLANDIVVDDDNDSDDSDASV